MPSFTLSQKKAHDPYRHLSVTANAGSGKTRVLVSRYCDLVEQLGYNPRSIAAITFTEKAASELRAKIADEFERRLDDEAHKEHWERLKRGRERFTSAIVSTIHGFCAQLLREYPIEADVPPNFTVVSGYERRELEEKALMDAIEGALDPAGGDEAARTYDTVRRVGREKMEMVVRTMFWKREAIELGRRDGVLTLGKEETLALWQDAAAKMVREALVGSGVLPVLKRMIGYTKPAVAEQAMQALAEAESAADTDVLLNAMHHLLFEVLLTADGKGARKKSYDLAKGEFPALDGLVQALQPALGKARRFLEYDPDPALHETLYNDTQVLLGIYDSAMQRYDAMKSRANKLDFEDLQLRLLWGLEREEMANAVAGRFNYVMVDEFQDTNELQYGIVHKLLQGLGNGKLCIVGDEKQSIYGFRNAEVEVFTTATNDITTKNAETGSGAKPLWFRGDEIEPGNQEEGLGIVTLNASFRLLPSISAYVNRACAPVMKSPATASFGVQYKPLVCARHSSGNGKVELLLPPSPKKNDDDESVEEVGQESNEAIMIARRLLKMVVEGEQVVWERSADGTEQPRPARFSDMAVLCRKRSMFAPLEQAFRQYGIPFLTYGSTGFFKTQELYDVVNYLRTLLNSRDDIALLGVLRSPFFAVSDTELYRIGTMPKVKDGENDLWSRAVRRVGGGEAEDALKRAVETIRDDRGMTSRIPVSLLLRRIIERTGWRGAVIGKERGEQILANVDKLLQIAREFEAQGFTNLFDFVERVTAQIDAEEMESEAPVNTSRDAVLLMTMHAAKGLEFPVVLLPSLHSPVRGPSQPYFDKMLGFGWTWRFNQQEHNPLVTALMHARQQEKERAEEGRLFYVAATRARDMLILSGEYDEESEGKGTMLDWSIAPLGSIPDENGAEQLGPDVLEFLNPDGATIEQREWTQDVAVYRAIDDLPRYNADTDADTSFRPDLLRIGELPAQAEGEIYSASQFLIYTQCPTKYYLKYRLGLPEELGSAYHVDVGEKDSEDGTTFARLFRDVVAHVDSVAAAPDRAAAISAIVERTLVLEPLPEMELALLRTRLVETLERLLASDAACSELFPDGATCSAGQELRIPFGKDYLLGVMDRLTRGKNGDDAPLQYKTLTLGDASPEEVAAGYLPQVRLYAWLVSRLNPAQGGVRVTILFTDKPEAPQPFTFTRFDMVRIEEEIRSGIEDIRALSYSGRRELPLATTHCPRCAYWIEETCILGRAASSATGVAEALA